MKRWIIAGCLLLATAAYACDDAEQILTYAREGKICEVYGHQWEYKGLVCPDGCEEVRECVLCKKRQDLQQEWVNHEEEGLIYILDADDPGCISWGYLVDTVTDTEAH